MKKQSDLKIFSWNSCLGLFNKIDYLKLQINFLQPDILFVQETEINKNMDLNLLKIANYNLHLNGPEQGQKTRIAVYVRNNLLYQFETWKDVDLIKIKVNKTNIYGLYRPFKLKKSENHRTYFGKLIDYINQRSCADEPLIILGDFNLDTKMATERSYQHRKIYDDWLNFTDEKGLLQHVQKTTWKKSNSRFSKTSTLDHIYSPNPTEEISYIDTDHSDHLMVGLLLKEHVSTKKRRNLHKRLEKI